MVLSQQSKQKRNKIKIRILTAMFRFPIHTLKFEAPDQPQSTGDRKSFDTWYYSVTCATPCVSFSSKTKAINVFLKHILKSKARDQSNQARKKLFCHVIVKNYLSNVSWKFFDQNWKHVVERNQRTGTPAGFTVSW